MASTMWFDLSTPDGGVIRVDCSPVARSLYLFRRKCMGLERFRFQGGRALALYFVTLTLKDEWIHSANDVLNGFFNFLRARFRRAHKPFAYVWVVELQKRRYRRYGVLALHWHIAIACPRGALPHVEALNKRVNRNFRVVEDGSVVCNRDLVDRWGRGMVWSQYAINQSVYGYLSKYMTKDYESLDGYNPEWSNLRRFGGSALGHLSWPLWAYEWAERYIADYPDVVELCKRKVGSRVMFCGRDSQGRLVEVAGARSPYRVVASG